MKPSVVRSDRDQQIAAIDQFAAAPEIPEGKREAAANTNCRRFTQFRSLTANSGLVSLGPSFIESYRNAATHVSRILRGEKPGDLPVQAQAHLNKVARQLNERPRETLQFETPAERLNACVASTG